MGLCVTFAKGGRRNSLVSPAPLRPCAPPGLGAWAWWGLAMFRPCARPWQPPAHTRIHFGTMGDGKRAMWLPRRAPLARVDRGRAGGDILTQAQKGGTPWRAPS